MNDDLSAGSADAMRAAVTLMTVLRNGISDDHIDDIVGDSEPKDVLVVLGTWFLGYASDNMALFDASMRRMVIWIETGELPE